MKYTLCFWAAVCLCAFAQAKNLTVFNIVAPVEGAEKELAEDIADIQKRGIADTSLVIFTMVPEGNPPIDKFKILAPRYEKIRDAIGGRARLGILLQSTIGHGYPLKNPNALEHVVRIENLKENPFKCCPLGEGVKKYMREICKKAALLKPDHIMVDDDFRMYTSANNACCLCPLHLKKISERLGRPISAKEARAHMYGASAEDRRVAAVIDAVIIDSICSLAREMRAAIDEVDPKIRGSICVCDADIRYAKRLGEIFAGKGYEPIVRINNARYGMANATPKTFAHTMYRSAMQLAGVGGGCTVIAETDTLPHNRYGTSARSLHANYCGYIFGGCMGAKQWITCTSEYDPAMNRAYRDILAAHADFYETLAGEVKQFAGTRGFVSPVPSKPLYNMNPFSSRGYAGIETWAKLVCNTTGIPANFGVVGDNPAMISGSDLPLFSDAEIMRQLARGAAFDSAAAVELCRRGYAKYLGVDASPMEAPRVNGEIVSGDPIVAEISGKVMNAAAGGFATLKPNSPSTRVLAQFVCKKFTQDNRANFERLSPSATYFENSLGGKIIVLGSNLQGGSWISYTRYPRKKFLLAALNAVEKFDLWYPGDAEVFMQTAVQRDGAVFAGVYNFGWDPLECVELAFARQPKTVKILRLDGSFEDASFKIENGVVKIAQRLEPMYPVFVKVGF